MRIKEYITKSGKLVYYLAFDRWGFEIRFPAFIGKRLTERY